MIVLNKKQINNLLKSIKNPEDRKVVRFYLKQIQRSSTAKGHEINDHGSEGLLLDILLKLGFKIGEHIAIDKFLDLFD